MKNSDMKPIARYCGVVAAAAAVVVSVCVTVTGPPLGSLYREFSAVAEPPTPPVIPNDALIRPLPVIVPTPSNWSPKVPWAYGAAEKNVTPADINAMGEMCQWFNAQYQILNDQISRLQFNRIGDNGADSDYSGIQRQVDVVTQNIDQALAFLGPRVNSLTQSHDYTGDVYFPVYKGDAFYKLWQQLSNINDGIKAHQPDWFTGPSQKRAKQWGDDITRSHVCRP